MLKCRPYFGWVNTSLLELQAIEGVLVELEAELHEEAVAGIILACEVGVEIVVGVADGYPDEFPDVHADVDRTADVAVIEVVFVEPADGRA